MGVIVELISPTFNHTHVESRTKFGVDLAAEKEHRTTHAEHRKAMNPNLKVLVGLFAFLFATQANAMRWYSPSTGRWLSRDPLGDEAFIRFYSADKSASKQRQLRNESLGSLYVFVNQGLSF